MGAASSHESASGGAHVITSTHPVRLSEQLVDKLSTSPETDRSRALDRELHVQQRVKSELQRLERGQDEHIAAARDATESPLEVPGGADAQKQKDLDRAGVQKEIDELREKLRKRRLKEEVVNDKKVEKARTDVVNCLRLNDRRPLDCWKEVEEFRREVRRLEGEFIGKVLE